MGTSNQDDSKLPKPADEALKGLRQFYRKGQTSLKKHPSGFRYRRGDLEKEAERAKLSPELLRKARKVADPNGGYSDEEFESLVQQIRAHDFRSGTWVFGRSFVIRLVTVPRRARDALQRRVIKEEWSFERLEEEIRLRRWQRWGSHGPQWENVGRRRRVPEKTDSLLSQIRTECRRWERWLDRLIEPLQEGQPALMQSLPPDVRKRLPEIAKQVAELRNSAEKAAKTKKPSKKAAGKSAKAK